MGTCLLQTLARQISFLPQQKLLHSQVSARHVMNLSFPPGSSWGNLYTAPNNLLPHQDMPAAGVSEFPIFSDGDVKIVITGGRTYQLHSTILKNSSPVMRALLPVENSAKLTTKAIKRGVVIRYRLNVVAYPVIGADNTFSYVLEPTLLDSDGKASHHATVPLHLENGRVTPPILLVRCSHHEYRLKNASLTFRSGVQHHPRRVLQRAG